MSASSAFGTPVVRRVGDKDVTFPLLTMREYGQLESTVKQKRRDVERALLDELQVAGKDRLPSLRNIEMTPVLIGDVINYLNSAEGTKKALALSVGEEVAGEVLKSLPFIEAKNLVGEICDLGGAPVDPPKAGATGEQTPPASGPQASNPAV